MNDLKLSVVIPVYKSEALISQTVEQTVKELKIIERTTFEIILINDGSPDSSWEVIKGLANQYVEVTAINLVKNYGQHNAVLCGFAHSRGDYVVTMDDDLQNPPCEIKHLVQKIQENDYDLVFGKFKEKKHAAYRKLGTKLVGYFNAKVFNKPRNIALTNFRIIRKDVIERVLRHRTPYPYIPGLVLMYASSIANVLVEHHSRTEGESNYTAKKILGLLSRLLINYSSYPLRILSLIGLFVSGLSFLVGTYYLISGLFLGSSVQGWTTLVVLTSFLGGFIIVLLGVIGEYLSRILDQLSSDRSYFVKEVVS